MSKEKVYTIKVDSVDAALIAGGLAAIVNEREGWVLAHSALHEVEMQLKDQGLNIIDELHKQLTLAKERAQKREK